MEYKLHFLASDGMSDGVFFLLLITHVVSNGHGRDGGKVGRPLIKLKACDEPTARTFLEKHGLLVTASSFVWLCPDCGKMGGLIGAATHRCEQVKVVGVA